jgi:hypothetical protein
MLRLLNLAKQGKKEEDSGHQKMKLASQGANWKKLKAPIKSYLDDVLIVTFFKNKSAKRNLEFKLKYFFLYKARFQPA